MLTGLGGSSANLDAGTARMNFRYAPNNSAGDRDGIRVIFVGRDNNVT